MSTVTETSGGVVITSSNLGTAGTPGNPWLIGLSLSALGIIQFNGGNPDVFDGPLQLPSAGPAPMPLYASGQWNRVTILNTSAFTWTSFNMQPQVEAGTPSPDDDGYSFMQTPADDQWCSSDKFPVVVQTNFPSDNMDSSGGTVAPGESVTFVFPLTMTAEGTPLFLQFTPFHTVQPLVISCNNPPVAHVAAAYLHEFPTLGGVVPYTYTLAAGTLPPGLTLNSSTGVLEGVPTTSGVYEFTIRVTDAEESVDDAGCSILVKRCLLVNL